MWWLNVFFLINGLWVPGHSVSPDGWSPRAYPTEWECRERKVFAERACHDRPLEFPATWVCSKGGPLTEPPPGLRDSDRDC